MLYYVAYSSFRKSEREESKKKKDQLRRKENPWSDFCALILFPDIKD